MSKRGRLLSKNVAGAKDIDDTLNEFRQNVDAEWPRAVQETE